VIVIGPPLKQETGSEDIESRLAWLLKSHSVKEAASIMAEQTGKPRKEIYALALKLAGKNA
jgi:16S rRNA (cytidine1402-2'-O)-methyltransferase